MGTRTDRSSRSITTGGLSPGWARWGRALCLATFVVGPLLTFPPNTVLAGSLDTPRRLLYQLVAGILAALVLCAWASRGSVAKHVLPDRRLILFTLAAVISAAVGVNPRLSFLGPIWSQQDPLPLLWCAIILYLGIQEFFRTSKDITDAAHLLVATGGMVAVLGLLDFGLRLRFNPAYSGLRLTGTLGNPMFAGAYFAMLIPLGLATGLQATGWRRWILLVCTGLLSITLLFTMARAAWAGVVIALLILAIILAIHRLLPRRALLYGVGALTFILLVAILQPAVRRRLTDAETLRTRLLFMQTACRMVRARPLFGWGPGNALDVFPQFRPATTLREGVEPMNRGYTTALPHNWVLQTAVEMGIIGLAAWLWLLWGALRGGIVQLLRYPHLAAGLLGLLLASLCTNLLAFDNAATLMLCWTGLGLLAALSAAEISVQPARQPLSEIARGAMRVIAVLIVLSAAGITTLDGVAACYTQQGLNAMDRMATADNARHAREISAAAAVNFHAALAVSPCPDNIAYRRLFLACRAQLSLAPESVSAQAPRDSMLDAGQRALAISDRDWKVLRTLSLYYLQTGDLPRARGLIDRLLHNEPTSGEVRLLSATLLERQGDVPGAIEQAQAAVQLDPSCPEFLFTLAHERFALVLKGETSDPALPAAICRDFAQARAMGAILPPAYQLEYASALLLIGDKDEACRQAATLHGTPLYRIFTQRLASVKF